MKNYYKNLLSILQTPSVHAPATNIKFVAFFLFSLSFILRLPFFFTDVIEWDESTYILMGQSLLDGFNPDLDYWHIRAYPYAFFIALFGKTIPSIRFAGVICIFLISLFTYIIGNKIWDSRSGFLGAILCIFLLVLLPSGQSTMSEHIALVPFVGALCLLVTTKSTPRVLFFVGNLIAVASLIRMNLAYVSIIIGLFVLFAKHKDYDGKNIQLGLAYAAGGILILVISFIPYAVVGQERLWLSINFLSGLSYADSQATIWETFKYHITYLLSSFSDVKRMMLGVSALVWVGGAAGVVLSLMQWKELDEEKRHGLLVLFLFLFGTWISILKGGAAYPHYLIQLVPFMAIISASFISFLINNRAQRLTVIIVVLALVISLKPIVGGYKYKFIRFIENKELYDGPAYEIAAYINQENITGEPVFIMERQIVYWLINSRPISKSTVHPSNIAKPYLLEHIVGPASTTKMEMAKILEKRPKYIVKTDIVKYLKDIPEVRSMLKEALVGQYELVKQVREFKIFRRI